MFVKAVGKYGNFTVHMTSLEIKDLTDALESVEYSYAEEAMPVPLPELLAKLREVLEK